MVQHGVQIIVNPLHVPSWGQCLATQHLGVQLHYHCSPIALQPLPNVCRTAEKAAAEEPRCECMFCGAAGPESNLSCAACHRALPFCAASGRRMALNDWSSCPCEALAGILAAGHRLRKACFV